MDLWLSKHAGKSVLIRADGNIIIQIASCNQELNFLYIPTHLFVPGLFLAMNMPEFLFRVEWTMLSPNPCSESQKNVKRPILLLTARIRLRLLKHTCSILQPCKSIVQLSYFYFMIYSKSRTDHTSLQPEVRNVFEAGCLSFRCHLQRVADTVISQGKWNDLIARFICVSNF